MGSIPLPALNIRPAEQPDVLGSLARLAQYRGLQQEQQIRAQQLQNAQLANQSGQVELAQHRQQLRDQQAMTQAMQEWDGRDLNSLPSLVLKHGASAQAVMTLKTGIVDQQQKLATLGTDQLKLQTAKNDQLLGLLNTVKDGPGLIGAANEAINRGLIDPQHAQAAQQLAQLPPDQLQQQLDVFKKGLMGQGAQLEQASKQAEIGKSTAQTDEAKAHTRLANMQADMGGGATDATRFTADYLQSHGLQNTPANRQQAFQAFTKLTKIDPGVARANIFVGGRMVQVADPNNPGQTIMVPQGEAGGMAGAQSASVQVPRGEAKYMTSGKGGQQLTAFNTAMTHLDTLQRLSADLNNSDIRVFNRAAQNWADQTGNPAPANFAAAKNAMSGEVASALKASGATDQEIAKVGDTFDRAQSPRQLFGAIGTYRELLKGKRDQLKGQFDAGMQGKPNFGGPSGDGGTFNWNQFGGVRH